MADPTFDREQRLRAVVNGCYTRLMSEITDNTKDEDEVRYFMLGVLDRIVEGLNSSVRGKLLARDLGAPDANTSTTPKAGLRARTS